MWLAVGAVLGCPLRAGPVQSLETGHTVTRVRTAQDAAGTYVVASSYEGTVFGLGYDGTVRWENPLSGAMNHDLWCQDLDGDGIDEVLAANADGSVYCLDASGAVRWTFKANEAPMYAVCALRDGPQTYVACGGFDMTVYLLDARGRRVHVLPSSSYSGAKSWGAVIGKKRAPSGMHNANFLRPLLRRGRPDALVVHGVNNGMQDVGEVYVFDAWDARQPRLSEQVEARGVIGDVRVVSQSGGTGSRLLLGTSGSYRRSSLTAMDPESGRQVEMPVADMPRGFASFGYRVLQPELIRDGDRWRILMLFGEQLVLLDETLDAQSAEVFEGHYSYNDLWKDPSGEKLILGSAQSGGSCVHVIDLTDRGWKRAFETITPPGKINVILDHTARARGQLAGFRRPADQPASQTVYLLSDRITDVTRPYVEAVRRGSGNPVFLGGRHMPRAEKYDRSEIPSRVYRKKRDRRRKYTMSRQDVLDHIVPWYDGYEGIAYWGGHGNDPYMFAPETTKQVLDAAQGKKTVLIYPELEDHSPGFIDVMNHLIYPLAEHARARNAKLYIRTKHVFWQGSVYQKSWARLLSGEFADVFVPSMEETSGKSMELSVAGRMGIWASGAVDSWGARSARDNPSFDRSREISHQNLPNHFLRQMVYNVASGAQYLNNFSVDQKYMSFLWELIDAGALFVPARDQIVSFSPVHLSMHDPDPEYMDRATNVKWNVFYEDGWEKKNPMVFGRLNGTWMGAPNTAFDFSRYAAQADDRRLNFIPKYEHGLVLITPPQDGPLADPAAPRGRMEDHLHPLYHGKLKEFYTDGRSYLSADGKKKRRADRYFDEVAEAIRDGETLLPLTVTGGVGWVVAELSPTRLRLTMVDGGYLNPGDREAVVSFHASKPVAMTDVLSGESFVVEAGGSVVVPVPCGLFRFLDIELAEPLVE